MIRSFINPKNNFYSGVLTSAYHLCSQFGLEPYQTDSNNYLQRNGFATKHLNYQFPPIDSHIICNDSTGEKGQYDIDECIQLLKHLSKYEKVELFIHAPIGRQFEYFTEVMPKYLDPKKVTLWHYRRCNQVFGDQYLPDFQHNLIPYFFDLDLIKNINTEVTQNKILQIGRQESTSKLNTNSLSNLFNLEVTPYSTIAVDDYINNLKTIAQFKYISGGFYQDGTEVRPEIDMIGNKLEWSAIEGILLDKLVITSDLYQSELRDLSIRCPLLSYTNKNLLNIDLRTINNTEVILWNHEQMTGIIDRGNEIFREEFLT